MTPFPTLVAPSCISDVSKATRPREKDRAGWGDFGEGELVVDDSVRWFGWKGASTWPTHLDKLMATQKFLRFTQLRFGSWNPMVFFQGFYSKSQVVPNFFKSAVCQCQKKITIEYLDKYIHPWWCFFGNNFMLVHFPYKDYRKESFWAVPPKKSLVLSPLLSRGWKNLPRFMFGDDTVEILYHLGCIKTYN